MSDSQELVVTSSYHTEDGFPEEDGMVYVNVEEVPSHLKVMLAELCSSRNKKLRCVRSRGAILVLVVTCMVNISFNAALGDILRRFFREILHVEDAGVLVCLGIIFIRSVPQLAYPLAGWVADVHYGRYKVILASLWLMLFGHTMVLLAFLVKYFYDPAAMQYVVYFGIFPAAFLAINTGLAAFQANVIPFGLDQMPDASTEEVSAFIHWYYGSRNLISGIIPLGACYVSSNFELSSVAISASEVLCTVFALFLCNCFKKSLIIEPKSVNPFKLVQKVLRFAFKNKHPLLRSAFTFWEAEIPSRIDLGKSKYGGPFSNEEVEDVKTFIRTTGVLVAASAFMTSYYTLLLVGILFSNKLRSAGHIAGSYCRAGLFYQIVLDTFPVFVMVALFETIIYPFFKVCVPSMLRRIGLGMGVAIVGLLVLLVLDVYGYNRLLSSQITTGDPSNVSYVEFNCFLVNDSLEQQVDISAHAVSSVMLVGALAETIVFIAALEFIASQSPYGMRGMLVGAFYCIRGVFGFLTALLFLAFTLGYVSHPPEPPVASGISCGLPLNATVIVASLVGLIVYTVVARNHKRRERDDDQFNPKTFAENYFYGSITTNT